MRELEAIPKWRLWMLLPLIGAACVVGVLLAKIANAGEAFLEMTEERRRMLIRAERNPDRLREEGKELS